MKREHQQDLDKMSDEQISKLKAKYYKGCGKIYHQPGVMTAKGDALYDFTCNSSHRCRICEQNDRKYSTILWSRNAQKQRLSNKKQAETQLESYRKKYFSGKPDCKCQKDQMCKECLEFLQNDVTKYEKGCGKTWEQEFGGMAAGPAWVTCADNYFLCNKCSEPLAFINRLNKDYPHVKLEHMPQIQKMFWAPRNYPYYSGQL